MFLLEHAPDSKSSIRGKKECEPPFNVATIAAGAKRRMFRCGSAKRHGDVFAQIVDIVGAGEQSRLRASAKVTISIKPDGQPMLNTIRVRIDWLPSEIRRIVKLRAGVSGGHTRFTDVTMADAERATQGTVAIGVVEREDAIRRVMPCTERIARQIGAAECAAFEVDCPVRAAARGQRSRGSRRAPSGKDLDHAGYGVGAVQDT